MFKCSRAVAYLFFTVLLLSGWSESNAISCSPKQASCSDAPLSPLQRGDAGDSLTPTLTFRDASVQGGERLPIAWQNSLPVPSFDPQDRPRLSLAGHWRKQRVQLDDSLTLGTQNLTVIEAEAKGRHLPEFDDRRWQQYSLPMVENAMPSKSGDSRGPELFEGGVWYRRSFSVPAEWQDKRVTLNLLGANYVVDVWVNGQWIGYHEGGYTPFALDVSQAITYGGSNVISVRVANFAAGTRTDVVPARVPDWWNYTGIIQDIYLEAAPALWVVRADVRTPDLSGAVDATIIVHNAGQVPQRGTLTLRVRETDPERTSWLDDPRASAIASRQTGEEFTTSVEVEPGTALVVPAKLLIPEPQLWSPYDPNLYVLEAELVSGEDLDRVAYQFGIRTLGTEAHRLLLNEQPFFLAGIARHEEWPDSGRTATWEKIRSDLQAIKGMGANFLRAAHYPNHPYTYLLTDRLGLATAAEIPIWQYTEVEFAAQEKRRIADQMWREMLLSGSNRPSLLFWSTNNEPRELPYRIAFNRRLIDDFQRHLQDGRMLIQSAAADRGGPADESQNDFRMPGWTNYFGVFYGSDYYHGTKKFLQDVHTAFPQSPILNTEFGIWSSGGGSNESRQALVYSETFRAFTEVTARFQNGAKNPDGFLAGVTWWTMYDWYSPSTSDTKLQTMGLYHMDRQSAKPVAELLEEGYRSWKTP